MNQNKPNETNNLEQPAIVKEPEPDALGIVGDTTNHDLVMTRLWIRDNICENISISVLGAEFTKARALKVEKHLKGKKLDDIELIIGLKTLRKTDELSSPLDVLFESIYRACDDYQKRQEMKIEEAIQSDETPVDTGKEVLKEGS